MRKTLSILLTAGVAFAFASGCSTLSTLTATRGDDPVPLTKRFYNGAISYTIDLDAQPLITSLVNLQGSTASLESMEDIDTRSDRFTLPLYRDADLNRNRHISKREAEVFYAEYVRQFEDSLGQVYFR